MVFVRSGGVQGDGTDHTKAQAQIFSRFGLTWHRKVHFSEILEFQCTRNGPRNLPFCPGSLQDTFIIYSSISHQRIFSEIFPNEKKEIRNLEIRKSDSGTHSCFFPPLPPSPPPPFRFPPLHRTGTKCLSKTLWVTTFMQDGFLLAGSEIL